jgi:hypothetical protein
VSSFCVVDEFPGLDWSPARHRHFVNCDVPCSLALKMEDGSDEFLTILKTRRNKLLRVHREIPIFNIRYRLLVSFWTDEVVDSKLLILISISGLRSIL